jgi:hypothetical protein
MSRHKSEARKKAEARKLARDLERWRRNPEKYIILRCPAQRPGEQDRLIFIDWEAEGWPKGGLPQD